MSFERYLDEAIEALRAKEMLDIRKILEKPESAFEREEMDPAQKKQMGRLHESIVSKPELFVGRGNDGVVFDYPSETDEELCLKNIWEDLSVEIKGHRYFLLPQKMQELRKIQDHFEEVKKKKREFIARGREFPLTNTPAAEAGLQMAAHMLLEAAGFENGVPEPKSIIRIESKDGGMVGDLPYDFREVADIIVMEKVPGKSIQDFILHYEDYAEAFARLDPEAFKTNLRAMIQVLHDENLTHQDVTKRNIMFDFKRLMPVIIDFGKSSYGMGSFTKEQEMEQIEEICRVVLAFKNNPEKTRVELKKALKIDF